MVPLPKEKALIRTEEILSVLAKLRSTEEPIGTTYSVVPFGNIYTDNPNADYGKNQLLEREEVAQMVRKGKITIITAEMEM